MSAEATIDADQEIIVECDLDAPQEKVWRALTTPELAADWLNAAHGPSAQESTRQTFEIVESEPFSRVVYRWGGWQDFGKTESFVTIEIERRGVDSTWFRLTHRPPESQLVAANCNAAVARAA